MAWLGAGALASALGSGAAGAAGAGAAGAAGAGAAATAAGAGAAEAAAGAGAAGSMAGAGGAGMAAGDLGAASALGQVQGTGAVPTGGGFNWGNMFDKYNKMSSKMNEAGKNTRQDMQSREAMNEAQMAQLNDWLGFLSQGSRGMAGIKPDTTLMSMMNFGGY